jgi:glycerol-3-phosphate acyltransferase PlsY
MPAHDLSWFSVTGAFLLAYLVGSIPFGLFIAFARGIDIRKHGSGNIGATNVGRVLGPKAWLACFTLDFAKGLLPSLGAGAWLGLIGSTQPASAHAWVWVLVMAGPVLGHMFCPWLKFRGGKGVATGLGAMLGVYPILTIAGFAAAAVWLAAAARWRYVSRRRRR